MMTTSERGTWALKWSFAILIVTGIMQLAVVWMSGSVALLSDTIHNFADALTAVPLWIAFRLSRLKPTRRFSYGYGRLEDLAGIAIVAIILFSAVAAAQQSIERLIHPTTVQYLGAVFAASLIGFVGNEYVAYLRIRVGREINSAALIADGQHARVDGLTSLAVFIGALGVWLGYPLADPIVGMIISLMIFFIVWESIKTVFLRLLDGVEPGVLDQIESVVLAVPGVKEISEVRARWSGHRLNAEINIAVEGALTVAEGHEIAKRVYREVIEELPHVSKAVIHVDPTPESGESHHEPEVSADFADASAQS